MGDCSYCSNPALGGGAGSGKDEGSRLSFVLPDFPVSVNKLHEINHLTRTIRPSEQAALWRTRMTPFVKPCRWPKEWLLKLTLVYESSRWHHKNGALRRVDLDNLLKLTIDTMFGKWGMDDSRIVEIVTRKQWGATERVLVTLERVEVQLDGGN